MLCWGQSEHWRSGGDVFLSLPKALRCHLFPFVTLPFSSNMSCKVSLRLLIAQKCCCCQVPVQRTKCERCLRCVLGCVLHQEMWPNMPKHSSPLWSWLSGDNTLLGHWCLEVPFFFLSRISNYFLNISVYRMTTVAGMKWGKIAPLGKTY